MEEIIPNEQRIESITEIVYQRFRELQIEPPTPKQVERLIRQAISLEETKFCHQTLSQLTPAIRAEIDILLTTEDTTKIEDESLSGAKLKSSDFAFLKYDSSKQRYYDSFEIRNPEIWGEGTTTCASDSKHFGAWEQNLMTQYHLRYRGRGVMIYWHVEKKSTCIYSQLKTVSSSEVAAMIEGVLRHCTSMEVKKNYVDSHGQSEVSFAFTHLQRLNQSDLRAITPLIFSHVNPYGTFKLDLSERISMLS